MNIIHDENGHFSHNHPVSTQCVVDDCENPVLIKQRGLCRLHYLRFLRHGDSLSGAPRRLTKKGEPLKWMQEHIGYRGDDCLIFPYGRHSAGYGALVEDGKRMLAHRWVCEKVYGHPPEGKEEAAHSCGNGHLGCVNPKHLRWATFYENVQDREAHGRTPKGEDCVNAVLTGSEVETIFSLKQRGDYQSVSERFRVSEGAVADIWAGRSWSWLTGMNGGKNVNSKTRQCLAAV